MNLVEAIEYKQQIAKANEDFNLHVIGGIKAGIAEGSNSVAFGYDDWDGVQEYYMDEPHAQQLRTMGYDVERNENLHCYIVSGW